MDILERAGKIAEESGGGWLPTASVESLLKGYTGGIEQLMLALIPLASEHSRPAISGYRVGAVAQGVSGALYFGANFEFGPGPLSATVHAEQATVVNAISHLDTGLSRLAVSAPPCGYCRQFLYELAAASKLRILLAGKPAESLTNLLPGAFGPGDLGLKGGLLQSDRHALEWISEPSGPAATAAFEAASVSYAPYTGAFAGLALVTHNGGIFAGPYLENAAFNPTLGPAQSAAVAASLSGIPDEDLAEAVLVQLQGTRLDHAVEARAALEKLAPQVRLQQLWVRTAQPSATGAKA